MGSSFVCATCVATWIVLWCGLKPANSCAGLFGSDCSEDQCQMLPVMALGFLYGAAERSIVCGCLFWVWVCIGGAKLCANVSFQQLQVQW